MAKTKAMTETQSNTSELAQALREVIEITRPMQKKTISNRVKGTPWSSKDGSPKLKLKRIMYQHSLKIDEDRVNNEEIALLNKIKPGSYCDGYVRVVRRKDRGIDIDYPVKTASQRLRLINDFGVVSFQSLLERLVAEAAQPKKIENEDVDE